MPKVVITPRSYGLHSHEIWDEWAKAGIEVVREAGPLPEPRLAELLRDADALLVGTDVVSRAVLEGAASLKAIAKYGVGIDNIDTEFCAARGIRVFNTPGVNTESVADHTFGLMLALARNIVNSHNDLVRGKWHKSVGIEIWGKTIGILGTGAIGKAVARRALGFQMKILAFDLFPDARFAETTGAAYADLETVLRGSDVVTVHLALTPETKHLIGERELGWMKRDALLINTARGGIVEEDALYRALSRHAIAGAALDVFQQEPPEASPLRELDNIICTPHNASSSVEAIVRMTRQSTLRILSFFYPHSDHDDLTNAE